jgi:hypothetical protein
MSTGKKIIKRLRGKKPAQAPQIRLSPSQERKLVKKLAREMQAQPLAGPAVPKPGSSAAARSGAFRFRRHLVVFEWIALLLGLGLLLHWRHAAPAAAALGFTAAIAIVLGCRHLSHFARTASLFAAALTALWLPLIALWGGPPAAMALISWCFVAVKWVKHYRWREEVSPQKVPDDYETWNLLSAERKWNGHLGALEALPGGGRRYPIQLDGIKTTIGNVLSASENVAGAWHKPMTEAYAERDPAGITSRGYLTILGTDTLMKVRHWNGAGIDPATGMAVIGRYADGSPAHMKFITPRYGTRHALISGTTGSGKSQLLDLIIFIALMSGFVPIVLDPQEGQSLPFWRDRVLYAAGVDECLAMQTGLHAGSLARSRYLSSVRWDDDGIPMRGMPFYDRDLTGLPPVLTIFDEAHMMLADPGKLGQKAVSLTEQQARLDRKTGKATVLATHIPSLADLGGSQALRDMLRGGGVSSLRTANRVASGMLGLEKDPSEIPMFFPDGTETAGLGYTAGPDNRPDAPMRTDLVPKAMRLKVPPVPQLDGRFREAMDTAMGKLRIASVPSPASLGPSLAAVPDVAGDDGPEGRTCSDAILAVLDGEMTRGQIVLAVSAYARSQWDRRPFSVKAVQNALSAMTADGRLAQPEERGPYRRALTAVK